MDTPLYPPSMDTEPYVSPRFLHEGDHTDWPCYRCGEGNGRVPVILRKGMIPVCVPCFNEAEARDFYLEMRAEDERLRRLGKRV